MMRSSSVLLQMATKGRAYFSEVTILVPHKWKISEDDMAWKSTSFNSTAFSDPRAALTIDEADVVVTTTGQYPYVLHQGGCVEPAMRIILPADFLLRNNDKGKLIVYIKGHVFRNVTKKIIHLRGNNLKCIF